MPRPRGRRLLVLSGGPRRLVLRGTSYVSTPDSAALSVTGDLDVRCDLALDNWATGEFQTVVAKWTGENAYALNVGTDGSLRLDWVQPIVGQLAATSSVVTGLGRGQRRWVRATLDVNNGAAGWTARFYTSTDGVNWTQLGSDQTGVGVTSITDTAAPVEIGGYNSGATQPVAGFVYAAQIRNGIDGTVVASPNFAAQLRRVSSFRDAQGNVWTLGGAAYIG